MSKINRSALRGLGLIALSASLALTTACSARGGDTPSGGTTPGATGDECPAPDKGWTADEIRIGASYPLSGPASAYGTIPEGAWAYLDDYNEKGGLNGAKINFIVYDDGYEPGRALDAARRLVEEDGVFAHAITLGTGTNMAVRPYLKEVGVPHALVASGSPNWGSDYEEYPWTIGWHPDYQSEMYAYIEYIEDSHPDATIAVIASNDEFGDTSLDAIKEAVQNSETNISIAATERYEITDASLDSTIIKVAESKADVFLVIALPKPAALALSALSLVDWKPTLIVNSVAADTATMNQIDSALVNEIQPITSKFLKEPGIPELADDPDFLEYERLMRESGRERHIDDPWAAYGMVAAQSLVAVLEQVKCPTRESLIETLENMDSIEVPMLLDGITLKTSKADGDRYPIEDFSIAQWRDGQWYIQK